MSWGSAQWGASEWGVGGGGSSVPIVPVIPIAATTIIRHRNPPSIPASFHRRHYIPFLYHGALASKSVEYLYANVGIKFTPSGYGIEYLYANVGILGKNIRDLYIPHKRWPIQQSFNTLASLNRAPEPLDHFVADLYEAIGKVISRPEFVNYTALEQYADQLRQAGVSSPTFPGITTPYSYESFGIRAAAQNILARYRDVEHAEEIANHIVDQTIYSHIRKTRIFFAIRHWTTSPPTRIQSINTQPDYLSHSIDPIPHLPDDLQFTIRNIRNRMALQERTNLIKIQHWAAERFLNVPGCGVEYLYANVRSLSPFAGPGSGLLGSGIIGQPLATRTATGRVWAARGRRGRVFWP